MATETRTGITWPAVSPVNLKFGYFRRAQDIQHVATGACMQPPQIIQIAKIGEGWGRLVINRIAHSASPAGAFQELQPPQASGCKSPKQRNMKLLQNCNFRTFQGKDKFCPRCPCGLILSTSYSEVFGRQRLMFMWKYVIMMT